MTTRKKTIALFGAGSGLGASLAKRFAREGYQIAMVARRAEKLQEHVAELVNEGLEAAAFPADLNDLSGIPALVQSIEDRFGGIDVAVYAPVAPNIAFVPAANLDAQTLRPFMDLYTYAPIQVANAVLQGQLSRGDGAIVVVGGLTAVQPIAGMCGFGPAMAAARNYVHTLNAELGTAGIYAGTVIIGALIQRSASFASLTAAGDPIVTGFPVIDPDDIAEEIWTMVTKRDRVESLLPAMSTL
ncbi:SDR family NAD(P)-dependent oxidoreductase [Pseudomonas sp. ICMP22404]|uniref:SDR family NAD(P)-dependent oxidoreductase n=1 Tax=Pseudomonas TaxID=286 RepID=UPI00111ACB05|nr:MULTISPECIES: SDR family NAD(P)-dependent oxidoreductase [Pseudomonas]MCI0995834.1 SDR family NAD(P)-dependent oxidoreductase [Pseudomonas corrugata]NUT66022.1 SDR family NAD(P)-dependent oxidoreductase [Pseudomonas corrugata]TNF84649.1 SDR family NAD(P)-dependent oxidoreductase [Pseudomonas sp. ICMP22404]